MASGIQSAVNWVVSEVSGGEGRQRKKKERERKGESEREKKEKEREEGGETPTYAQLESLNQKIQQQNRTNNSKYNLRKFS